MADSSGSRLPVSEVETYSVELSCGFILPESQGRLCQRLDCPPGGRLASNVPSGSLDELFGAWWQEATTTERVS